MKGLGTIEFAERFPTAMAKVTQRHVCFLRVSELGSMTHICCQDGTAFVEALSSAYKSDVAFIDSGLDEPVGSS